MLKAFSVPITKKSFSSPPNLSVMINLSYPTLLHVVGWVSMYYINPCVDAGATHVEL